MRRGPPGRRGSCARPSRRAIFAGIERRVDWPQLRANLKRTDRRQPRRTTPGEPRRGLPRQDLQAHAGAARRQSLIDAAVTPRTLARVLAGRLRRESRSGARCPPVRHRRGRGRCRGDARNDPLSPRRLRWAFFESPTRFRIEVADRTEPGKRVVSIFALQGASWKLVDVYYRTLT